MNGWLAKLQQYGISVAPDIIDHYSRDLGEVAKRRLELKGKRIDHANVEQPGWLAYYDERCRELNVICKWFEMKVDATRGRLWKDYTDNSSRELSPRDKDHYINNEPDYINYYELYLAFRELYEKYGAVVDGFKQRGYSLNNLTRLYTASLPDVIL